MEDERMLIITEEDDTNAYLVLMPISPEHHDKIQKISKDLKITPFDTLEFLIKKGLEHTHLIRRNQC